MKPNLPFNHYKDHLLPLALMWMGLLLTPFTGSAQDRQTPLSWNELPEEVRQLKNELIFVAGGTFVMGCQSDRDTLCNDREFPLHEVQIADFYIGRYEVTQAQWRAVMGRNPWELKDEGCGQCPVYRVSWNEVQAFLKKLNQITGERYRLPTEAEWEYAARGGSHSEGYLYSGSNDIEEVSWYLNNLLTGRSYRDNQTPREVGGKQFNELGLYDMSGNVEEWCEDDWHFSYQGAPADGSAWVDSPRGTHRVVRGGQFIALAGACRTTRRTGWDPRSFGDIGFRLVFE